MAKNKNNAPLSEKDVVAYINAHPDFLANYPEILAKCLAAAKSNNLTLFSNNPKIVDLSPALAARARDEARQLGLANKSLLHVAAENMVSWKCLHHATLGLLASTDLTSLCHVISAEFPVIFDLQKCALIIEEETNFSGVDISGLKVQQASKITAAMENHTIYLGPPNKAATEIIDIYAPSIALVRLPDRLPVPVSSCILLLVGKKAANFQPELGSDLLVLLAEMIGVTLAARLETPVVKK